MCILRICIKFSSVLVDKKWVWRPARREDLVSIQSFRPSIQIGGFDKPSLMPSKSGKYNTSETCEAIRFKLPVVAW